MAGDVFTVVYIAGVAADVVDIAMLAIVASGIESFEAPASFNELFSYEEGRLVVNTIAGCEVSSIMGIGDAELECVA